MSLSLAALTLAALTASPTTDGLRIATYNVQALSARDSEARFIDVARVIASSGFPAIVALQEIADDDGDAVSANASAEATLQRLVTHVQRAGGPVYRTLSVSPALNADGGPPGANIRSVVLTTLDADGMVAALWPDAPEFNDTRKPLSVRIKVADEAIALLTVHLSASPARAAKRQQQAQHVARWAATERQGARTIVLGDFNATADENVWPTLMQAGLHDTTAAPAFPTHQSGHAFDRIFVGAGLAPLGTAHVMPRTAGSDHALVWVDLQLPHPVQTSAGCCISKRPCYDNGFVLLALTLLLRRRRSAGLNPRKAQSFAQYKATFALCKAQQIAQWARLVGVLSQIFRRNLSDRLFKRRGQHRPRRGA